MVESSEAPHLAIGNPGDELLEVRKHEPILAGSSTYKETSKRLLINSEDLRLVLTASDFKESTPSRAAAAPTNSRARRATTAADSSRSTAAAASTTKKRVLAAVAKARILGLIPVIDAASTEGSGSLPTVHPRG